MTKRTTLRAVGADETPARDLELSLAAAVASGDVLQILYAQRRLVADALGSAKENTIPQLNNELNKLHALIAAEEAKRAAESPGGAAGGDGGGGARRSFDAAAL